MFDLLNWETKKGKIVIVALGVIVVLALLGVTGVIDPGTFNPIGDGGS